MHRKADTAKGLLRKGREIWGRNEKEKKGRESVTFSLLAYIISVKEFLKSLILGKYSIRKALQIPDGNGVGQNGVCLGPPVRNNKFLVINGTYALLATENIFCSWVTTEATAWILLFNLLFSFLGEPALDLGVESWESQLYPMGVKAKLSQGG